MGTFDNFNCFALRVAAARTESSADTLFVTSDDEPALLSLVAENVRYAGDFSLAEIAINPAGVRFHDGTPVKARP